MSFGQEMKDFTAAFTATAGVGEKIAKRRANRIPSDSDLAGQPDPGVGGGKVAHVQGEDDTKTSSTGKGFRGDELAWKDATPEQKALLNSIAGPESGGRYNVIYGGKTFDDYKDHPRVDVPIQTGPNAKRTSSAAGKYQFIGSTWDGIAKKYGLTDFSPENQDKGAWYLAAEQVGGEDKLNAILKSGDADQIAHLGQQLHGQWTSMPGGIEEGQTTDKFVSTYQKYLGQALKTDTTGGAGGGAAASTDESLGVPDEEEPAEAAPEEAAPEDQPAAEDDAIDVSSLAPPDTGDPNVQVPQFGSEEILYAAGGGAIPDTMHFDGGGSSVVNPYNPSTAPGVPGVDRYNASRSYTQPVASAPQGANRAPRISYTPGAAPAAGPTASQLAFRKANVPPPPKPAAAPAATPGKWTFDTNTLLNSQMMDRLPAGARAMVEYHAKNYNAKYPGGDDPVAFMGAQNAINDIYKNYQITPGYYGRNAGHGGSARGGGGYEEGGAIPEPHYAAGGRVSPGSMYTTSGTDFPSRSSARSAPSRSSTPSRGSTPAPSQDVPTPTARPDPRQVYTENTDPASAKGIDAKLSSVVTQAMADNPGLFTLNPYTVAGKRTPEQQQEMVDKGYSRTTKSKHVEGKGIDLVPVNPETGKPDPDYTAGYAAIQKAMNDAAAKVGIKDLTWGGTFKTPDLPHWQVSQLEQQQGGTQFAQEGGVLPEPEMDFAKGGAVRESWRVGGNVPGTTLIDPGTSYSAARDPDLFEGPHKKSVKHVKGAKPKGGGKEKKAAPDKEKKAAPDKEKPEPKRVDAPGDSMAGEETDPKAPVQNVVRDTVVPPRKAVPTDTAIPVETTEVAPQVGGAEAAPQIGASETASALPSGAQAAPQVAPEVAPQMRDVGAYGPETAPQVGAEESAPAIPTDEAAPQVGTDEHVWPDVGYQAAFDAARILLQRGANPREVGDDLARKGIPTTQWPKDIRDRFINDEGDQTPSFARGGAIEEPETGGGHASTYTTSGPGYPSGSSARRPEPESPQEDQAEGGVEEEENKPDMKPTRGLLDSVAQAVHGGVEYLTGHFQNEAVPTPEGKREAAQRFAQGEGAATREEIAGVDDKIDPQRELREGDRHMARLSKMTSWYLEQNRPKDAKAAAASLLQYGATRFGRLGSAASVAYEEYLQDRDPKNLDNTVKFLEQAYQMIPDGASVNVAIDDSRGVLVGTRTDADGNQETFDVSPDQLPGLIQSVQDKSAYWNQIFSLADPAGYRQKKSQEFSAAQKQDTRAYNEKTWTKRHDITREEKVGDTAASDAAIRKRAHEGRIEADQLAKERADEKAAAEDAKKGMDYKKIGPLRTAAEEARVAWEAEGEDGTPEAQAAYDAAASALYDGLPPGIDRDQKMIDMGFSQGTWHYKAGTEAGDPNYGPETVGPDGKTYRLNKTTGGYEVKE